MKLDLSILYRNRVLALQLGSQAEDILSNYKFSTTNYQEKWLFLLLFWCKAFRIAILLIFLSVDLLNVRQCQFC
jgi:hypothetical protein